MINSEIDLLVSVIINNNLELKSINDSLIKVKLTNIIMSNLRFNLILSKLGFLVSNDSIKNEILSNYLFKKNNKFDVALYKNFLVKNSLTDFLFQKNVSHKLRSIKTKRITDFLFKKRLFIDENILKYRKYAISYANSFFIKRDYLYNSILLKCNEAIINLDFINVSIKNIMQKIIVTNKFTKDRYNKNKYIYKPSTIVYVDHFKINKHIKSYDKVLLSLKKMHDISLLKNNRYLDKKANLLLNVMEFSKKFKTVIKNIDNSIVFFESSNNLHILIYKKKVFLDKSYFILDDIKNKCKKEEAQRMLLVNKSVINNNNFDYVAEKLLLPTVNVNIDSYIDLKILNILKDNLESKKIKINKYNYVIFKLSKNSINNDVDAIELNIDRYLENIKLDKLFLLTFNFNKNYTYDLTEFKFVSYLHIKKQLQYKKLLKYNDNYYYFNTDNYVKEYYNYKKFKDSFLRVN